MWKEGNDKRDFRPQTSLSLFLRKLADSAEEAGTIVTDRDCLSKGKKGEVLGSSSGEILRTILAQEMVETEMHLNVPSPEKSRESGSPYPLPATGWGRLA